MYCGWKGYLVSVDQDKKLLDLYSLWQQGPTGKWALSREQGEPLKITSEAVCIRACEVAVDERSGTRNLFLMSSQPQRPPVSASGQETTVSYRLLVYSQSRRNLLNYGQSLSTSERLITAEDIGKVSILDGPIVMWTEGSQLQVMCVLPDHSHKMMRQTYNLEKLMSDHFHLVKVIDTWPFLSTDETINSFDIDCSSIFDIFLKLEVASEDTSPGVGQSTTEWVCLQVKLSFLHGLAVELLQESELIPRDYGCISTCVVLHKSYNAGLSSGDIGCKHHYLVGTEYCQIVLLHKGVPLHCIALKYVPQQISLIDSGAGLLSFACHGNSGGEACAYQIDEDGPKVCGEWEGASHLVVGDFAHLGHDQLLLLFKDSLLDFLVTDLAQFNTAIKEGGEAERSTGQQCAESLIGVMNALQIQKYNGEAHLTGIKTELQLKAELLRKSLSFMKSLEQRSGEGEGGRTHFSMSAHRSLDPSLVCIVPGEVDVPESANQAEAVDQAVCEPPLKLVNLWQRFKNGLWVIGAVVQNQSSEMLKDLRFSIAPVKNQQTCSLDCSSRIVWIEQSNCSSKLSKLFSSPTHSPPEKRRKIEQPCHDLLPGLMEDSEKQSHDRQMLGSEMRVCVILSTDLPLMQNCSEQTVNIIATWKKARESSCPEEQVSEIGVANLSCQLLCNGELNLSESCLSLWNGNAFLPQDASLTEKGYQDLACVLGTSSFVLVEAHSDLGNLLSLPAMLRARLPLRRNAIITAEGQANIRSKSAIRSKNGSCTLEALEEVAIYVTPYVNSARIAVLFRSMHHLSLLLTSMRQCLPQEICLQLLTGPGTNVLASLRGCLTSILEEAKGRCKRVECRMRRGTGEEGLSQEEEKKVAKLWDKTDWTMTVATRKA